VLFRSLMDIDILEQNIPETAGLARSSLMYSRDGLIPIEPIRNLRVKCIGVFMRDRKNVLLWRAPVNSLIKQFLTEFSWGELDYLIVDCPPGIGDELISIIQILYGVDGAIIVTTPQDVRFSDVKKSIYFCRRVKLPIIGVVENMRGFICPDCGSAVDIFKLNGGEKITSEMGVPFLGKIPIDPAIAEKGDGGRPLMHYTAKCETAAAFDTVINTLLKISRGKHCN
jgi:ATP-binding protein involved in chromosome partitioning